MVSSGLTACSPGDVLEFHSAGGGGYGSPLERSPGDVEKDVLYEYISIERARADYGVVIDPATMKADMEATGKLRSTYRERKRTI